MNVQINRRGFLRQAGAATATVSLSGCSHALRRDAASKPPNIVYIVLDELGYFEPSCMGSDKLQTPNIDRLAAEGMRFTNAYAGGPTCAPTRSCLLTGLHMGHTSVRGNTGGIPLQAGDVTIADVLKKAGYATGGYGKWGVGDVGTTGVPEEHGFDDFFGYYHQVHAHNYYPEYLWRNSLKVPLPGNADGKGTQFAHHLIYNEARKFILENRDRPFFCYCPWTPPHGRHWPYPDDEPSWQQFKDKPWPRAAKVYAAMVSMVDRQIGEILALLKELGLDEDTIVVVSGDNGGHPIADNFFDPNRHFRGKKTQIYEGGLKVPMFARWPGTIPAGVREDLVFYFPDMMPTLAELAGASRLLPGNIDGISIVPTLLGNRGKQKKHDYFYWEYVRVGNWQTLEFEKDGLQQAVRMGDWKAIRMRASVPYELYDLQTDPGETNDLAALHPERVAKAETLARKSHVPMPQVEPEMPPGKRFR